MGLLLRTSLLILFIGTYLSNDIAVSASISKRPFAFLVEFFDKKSARGHQSNSFATISIVDRKESRSDRHLKISRVKNPEKFTDIFHNLYLQLANKKNGIIDFTEGNKVDNLSQHLNGTANCVFGPSTSLVKEIARALGGRKDLSKVVSYLAKSERELLQKLPNSLDGSSFS